MTEVLDLDFVDLTPARAATLPVLALLGVDAAQAQALGDVSIHTIEGLAHSWLFANALRIARHAEVDDDGAVGDLAQPGAPARWRALADSPLSALGGLDAAASMALGAALHVTTVRELARWAPYRAARTVLDLDSGYPDVPQGPADELVPRFGSFPTEVAYYERLVMGSLTKEPTKDLAAADGVEVSGSALASGFAGVATGAILQFEQSWQMQGLTLGTLLHSLALAPGESTRIAVVDWARKSSASTTEVVAEQDRLSNVTKRNRAISEVQGSVANEGQSGASRLDSDSTTESGSVSASASYGPVSASGTYSNASVSASAAGSSWSAGSRDIEASMGQDIADRTQQAASATRSRRASTVREVSQKESETVSTRIVANYNHMHALTVQYFEVIQSYAVRTRLNRATRALFVPLKPIAFTDDDIARYRFVLGAAALNSSVRSDLLERFGTIAVRPTKGLAPTPSQGTHASVAPGGFSQSSKGGESKSTSSKAASAAATVAIAGIQAIDAVRIAAIQAALQAAGTSPKTSGTPGSSGEAVLVPDDAVLMQAQSDWPSDDRKIEVFLRGAATSSSFAFGTTITRNGSVGIPLRDIDSMAMVNDVKGATTDATLTLILQIVGGRFPVTIPYSLGVAATPQIVARIDLPTSLPSVREHLVANRAWYTDAIYRSLGPSEVASVLADYSFEGEAVLEQVEPRPYGIVGNYMVLRMSKFVSSRLMTDSEPADDRETEWQRWLTERGVSFAAAQTATVSLPSGGVFAEAVLGRSNSAEHVDLTRYWNWQDSPIPLQAPEIAAVQVGSRAQADDAIRTGTLGSSLVSQAAPISLPDPTGVGAALQAAQNGSMFRDMSGMSAVADLAKTTSQLSQSAAAAAGSEATRALDIGARKEVDLKRLETQEKSAAGDRRAAVATAGAAVAGPPPSPTVAGGILNARAGAAPTGAAAAGAVVGGGSPGAPVPGARPVGAATGATAGRAATERTLDVLDRLSWGPAGESVGPSTVGRNELGVVSSGGTSASVLWPSLAVPPIPPLPPGFDITPWERLINFRAADVVQRGVLTALPAAEKRHIHHIEDAAAGSPLNLDYYSVDISVLPRLDGSPTPSSPERVLEALRRNLPNLVDKTNTEFSPLNGAESAIWNSPHPEGAVLHLDIHPVASVLPDDNAAVFCSESTPEWWIFSTLFRDDSSLFGHSELDHPVSGNRQFRLRQQIPGGWVFSTRGADRPTTRLMARNWERVFTGADELWRSLMAGVADWIVKNGGAASLGTVVQQPVDWDAIAPTWFHPTASGFPAWVDPPHPN